MVCLIINLCEISMSEGRVSEGRRGESGEGRGERGEGRGERGEIPYNRDS